MAIKQLSVFVENKPGKLLEIVKALAGAKVNIRAMSVADDCVVTVTPVIAAEMSDKAGALSSILEDFGYENINIEYMYAFTASTELGAYVVLRVDDNEAAERILKSKGISVLDSLSI